MKNNDDFEKTLHITLLYDCYGELLTNKQKEYFEYYYFDNYSLKEIAEIYNVSRSAIYDQIKIANNLLLEYEEKLKVYETYLLTKNVINEIKSLTSDEKILACLSKLEKDE